MDSPKLSIDALNTTTPNLAALADVAQYTYMHDRWTPNHSSIQALNTNTPYQLHIWENTYINQRRMDSPTNQP